MKIEIDAGAKVFCNFINIGLAIRWSGEQVWQLLLVNVVLRVPVPAWRQAKKEPQWGSFFGAAP
jgi:hypothetical protein